MKKKQKKALKRRIKKICPFKGKIIALNIEKIMAYASGVIPHEEPKK